MRTIKKVSLLLSFLIFLACQNKNKTMESRSDSVSVGQLPDPVDKEDGGNQPENETNESDVDGDGAYFMRTAALSGLMEVEMGKIGIERARDPKVKVFAEKMVKDHTKANMQLKALAKQVGILLPEVLPPKEVEHLEAMKQWDEKSFDQQYMRMMVKDHEQAVHLFKSATSLNKDVKRYILRTSPVIENHLAMAREVLL